MKEGKNMRNDSVVKRMPVVLCLDISPSMNGCRRIEHLNKAVSLFFSSLKNNTKVANSAEFAIVPYSTNIENEKSFLFLDQFAIPTFKTVKAGGTATGMAVNHCLDLIEKKKNELDSAVTEYYVPILVLITDGNPDDNDNSVKFNKAVSRITKLQTGSAEQRIIPFIIGVGDEVNQKPLDELCGGFTKNATIIDSELSDQENLFKDLFKAIGNSITCSIGSDAKEQVRLVSDEITEFQLKSEIKREIKRKNRETIL